jgi:hypothetical protein
MSAHRPIARDPDAYWDSVQEDLARRLRVAIEDAFENLPGMEKMQFAHAAAVLRDYANELSPERE